MSRSWSAQAQLELLVLTLSDLVRAGYGLVG